MGPRVVANRVMMRGKNEGYYGHGSHADTKGLFCHEESHDGMNRVMMVKHGAHVMTMKIMMVRMRINEDPVKVMMGIMMVRLMLMMVKIRSWW